MVPLADQILINAFGRAFKSARSIAVKRQTLWSRSAVGFNPLPVEVWIVREDGSTTIERGVDDDRLLGIAARLAEIELKTVNR